MVIRKTRKNGTKPGNIVPKQRGQRAGNQKRAERNSGLRGFAADDYRANAD